LEKRLAEQPGDSIVLARLATAYERAGAGSKAIGTYEQAIKQNAKSIPALLGLIRLHSGQRETSKALEYAKTARALAPDDPQIAHTLGRLTYQQGDHKYALSLLQESAARLPRAPEVLYDLAWAFLANGRVADALATMQAAVQAVQTFPQLDAARQFVSVVTLLEQPERAKASSVQVQQILQADPSYLPALAVSGLVQEQQGNAKAAQQVYERILDRFPLFTPANARLAILFAGPLQDYPKAHEHGLKARTAFPEDSEVAKAVGIAAYKRAEYPRAVQLLKETATKRTNDAEVFFYAGMAHFQLKQKPQCKEALTRALAIGGNASFVEEAKRTLAQLQ
jgi:tetratricopeptide (TPR) repeat protein